MFMMLYLLDKEPSVHEPNWKRKVGEMTDDGIHRWTCLGPISWWQRFLIWLHSWRPTFIEFITAANRYR
jgi:hypothetical protein